MYTGDERFTEYLEAIRAEVCSRCVERPPGGPPCAPLGKRCGIELNLPLLIDAVHQIRSDNMEPYAQEFHDHVCTQCPNRPTDQCPCPLEYLLILAVQAIEAVDERRLLNSTRALFLRALLQKKLEKQTTYQGISPIFRPVSPRQGP